jgi:hypothetical protein
LLRPVRSRTVNRPISDTIRSPALIALLKTLANLPSLFRRHVAKSLPKLTAALGRKFTEPLVVVSNPRLLFGRKLAKLAVALADPIFLRLIELPPRVEPSSSRLALIRSHLGKSFGTPSKALSAFGVKLTPLAMERLEHPLLIVAQVFPGRTIVLRLSGQAQKTQHNGCPKRLSR